MARGAEIAYYHSLVLERIHNKDDKGLAKEILGSSIARGVNLAYPLLHGFFAGFLSSMLTIHLFYGGKALEEAPFLLTIGLIIVIGAGSAWLFWKFHYGPKYRKLNDEFQTRLKNDQNFKRVHEMIKTIGKEIQAEYG